MRPIKSHWKKDALRKIISTSRSVRDALKKMGLRGAGGNYRFFEYYTAKYHISTRHFLGQGWSKGARVPKEPTRTLGEILVRESNFATHQLKKRLFEAGLKKPRCEECGWAKRSEDGRTPIEIDHINGNHSDNRLENLRILCPNCHSLKPTHRGRNKKARRGGETGKHATLKTL